MQVQKIASDIANSKFVKNHIQKSINDPKFLARVLMLTGVSKDVFAYALRVNNVLNNPEVPEDKKNYTAKMDAVSGFATAVTKITTGIIVSSDKFQNFCTKKLFESLKNKPNELAHAKVAFSALSTLLLSSVLAKRILTPLVAAVFVKDDKKTQV